MRLGDASLPRRFWAKVGLAVRSGCWLWLAANNGLYGKVYWNGRVESAHVVAARAAGLVIPPGFEVDHTCRHHRCVNPAHLEVVTHAVNMERSRGWKKPVQTHCRRGHALTGENVGVQSDGKKRFCVACDKERHRRYYGEFVKRIKERTAS